MRPTLTRDGHRVRPVIKQSLNVSMDQLQRTKRQQILATLSVIGIGRCHYITPSTCNSCVRYRFFAILMRILIIKCIGADPVAARRQGTKATAKMLMVLLNCNIISKITYIVFVWIIIIMVYCCESISLYEERKYRLQHVEFWDMHNQKLLAPSSRFGETFSYFRWNFSVYSSWVFRLYNAVSSLHCCTKRKVLIHQMKQKKHVPYIELPELEELQW